MKTTVVGGLTGSAKGNASRSRIGLCGHVPQWSLQSGKCSTSPTSSTGGAGVAGGGGEDAGSSQAGQRSASGHASASESSERHSSAREDADECMMRRGRAVSTAMAADEWRMAIAFSEAAGAGVADGVMVEACSMTAECSRKRLATRRRSTRRMDGAFARK